MSIAFMKFNLNMKYCSVISLIFMVLGLRGQDYVGVDFLHFDIENVDWDSEFNNLDSAFSDTGVLKAIRIEEKGIKYNCQYDSQGRQIMKYAVAAQTVIDTVFTEDPDTGEIWTGLITTHFVDVPNGNFESKVSFNSYGGNDGHDVINGQYHMGTKVGVWTLRKPIEYILISILLNEKGQPEGAYNETFFQSKKPKWIGQYKVVWVERCYADYDTGELIETERLESIPIGQWKRYSNFRDGKKTDEIEFKHY